MGTTDDLRKEALEVARQLIEKSAGSRLPPSFAKLYSQHTRLSTSQSGLGGWREAESDSRLTDAIRLMQAAFLDRQHGADDWQRGIRRAGELLEWLSHPQLNTRRLPLHLYAAAAYQIAGYPARASALLRRVDPDKTESSILRTLLRADFPKLMYEAARSWDEETLLAHSRDWELPWKDPSLLSREVHLLVVRETISSLGVLSAALRWGNESRLHKALEKLSAVADVVLHATDSESWILAKLCAEVAATYACGSLRQNLSSLSDGLSAEGQEAIERYIRHGYNAGRALAWPSQIRGIEKLSSSQSFALCTPTGSGKTAVAELAILQGLFSRARHDGDQQVDLDSPAPIVLYLVPSKALAAEVEAKLSRVVSRLSDERIIVTGLYGGTDWGPTDAWITADERTVLICTYEKGEALIRFLGPHFIHRIQLVVIDEAHNVQFNHKWEELSNAENRPLRLEALGMRLLTHLDSTRSRVIALSAVASGCENALAGWVASRTDAIPEVTPYRSTRQLIGRVECRPNRRFEICYDVLDGASLQFDDDGKSITPFIPSPFPPHPPAPDLESGGPEQRLRPYVFWAAMHLASPDENRQRHSVLISVMQGIGGYAEDLLELLESTWWNSSVPVFFEPPADNDKYMLWTNCLRACEDYFGNTSREYRLLKKGVVVHHGKMPGVMARLLIELIDRQVVHLVLATSTLSEGINLPFEVVLIPTLRRGKDELTIQEFANLVGRAGRPGVAVEGRSLVFLKAPPPEASSEELEWSESESRKRYFRLTGGLIRRTSIVQEESTARSPLAALILHIQKQWLRLSGTDAGRDFADWLETTAPLLVSDEQGDTIVHAVNALDSLDAVLLSAITELEHTSETSVDPNELEERLIQLWSKSYAKYANEEERNRGAFFVKRGLALTNSIYPDPYERQQLYRTALPPRAGIKLLGLYEDIKCHLQDGIDYARWEPSERLSFVGKVVELFQPLPKFMCSPKAGNSRMHWPDVLRWWLLPGESVTRPNDAQVSNWHNYVSQNFVYRINWGLGSIVALAMNENTQESTGLLNLDDWSKIGLPWIAFWIKDLLTWGTLEPVASFLLSHGMCVTRADAEAIARDYYDIQLTAVAPLTPNELLDPRRIRGWALTLLDSQRIKDSYDPPAELAAELLRDFSMQEVHWRVLPKVISNWLYWFDPAGFPLARSVTPDGWTADWLLKYDFVLNVEKQSVSSSLY